MRQGVWNMMRMFGCCLLKQYMVLVVRCLRSIYILCLSWCFLSVYPFVSNKRQNGWTNRAPGKVYGRPNFQKFASNKIQFLKINKFFYKIRELFLCFCFPMYSKRTCLQLKWKMDAKRPNSLVLLKGRKSWVLR